MWALAVSPHPAHAFDLHLQHKGLYITRYDNVAAPTQHEFGATGPLGVSQYRLHIRLAGDAHQGHCLGYDVEGVKGLEWDVFLD